MSTQSVALAAALQNSDIVGPLVTGVISGQNFDLQDSYLETSPYASIAVKDLPIQRTSYLNGPGGRVAGQLEVRCISAASEAAVKALAGYVETIIWATIKAVRIDQVPDTDENMQSWHEIMTVGYKA